MILLVRLLGTVACFCVDWKLGIVSILPVVLIRDPLSIRGSGIRFKSLAPRLLAEWSSILIGLYGVWKFPYLDPNLCKVFTGIMAVMVIAQLGNSFNKANSRR